MPLGTDLGLTQNSKKPKALKVYLKTAIKALCKLYDGLSRMGWRFLLI